MTARSEVDDHMLQTATWMDTRRRSVYISSSLWAIVLNALCDRYVAKVLYTYILGYKVDVGHMEAVNLISSHKYSEKQIVRQKCSLYLNMT